ncbi:DEAD/DEAH box helicase [Flavitalea sp. BT771]|uniref:DEAD/DEAH box helicase n=1 Tax=Flavitalea sp. BT771 TaxID=3063329 RepID=UPI0026E2EC55|nr:DEAD/DEAH box helicase [Flavitalea sp. BT771]MDO6435514.1 DEAD/DEAH box helicase [Flavitalea sp. BT771]MDV6224414.1 DEAD/DEAH box helicase [Flavitalea sp. BT771]
MSFQDLKLIEPLLKAVQEEGYTTPTPIQAQAIPIILERKDLLGCAQTGTGKTAAFAIPMLQLLCEDAAGVKQDTGLRAQRPIKALILTPTRELAIQIGDSFAAYGRHTGMEHLVIFGGVPQQSQVQALRRGIDILVATPGRLLDLMEQRHINLKDIAFFVLDEADRMLDMGFVHDVKKIIARLPQKRQSLFFSATMPPEIQKLSASILVNPSKVEVTPVSSTAETIQQSMYFVDKKDKRSLLLHILKTQPIATALVFTRTKHGADKVAQGLTRAGIRAEAIHGNKSQNARQRALLNFKTRQTRILVATDIAARGIDIDELTHVINFELPNVPETYVHRIGRTGRAGASGIALSFCDAEEKEFLRDIEKLIGLKVPVVEDHPHPLGNYTVARTVEASVQGAGNRNGGSRGRQNNGNGNNGRQHSDRSNNGRRDGRSNVAPAGRNGRPQRPGQDVIRKGAVSSLAELEALESQPQQPVQKNIDQQADHNKRELRREPQQLDPSKREARREPLQLDLNKREPKREPQQPDLSKREPKREPQQREPVKREPQQPARTAEEQKNFLANLKLNQSEGDEKW